MDKATTEALLYAALNGTKGPKGDKGDKGDPGGVTEEQLAAVQNALQNSKQDKLVSGTNIKTLNGETLLGSGDIGVVVGVKEDPDDASGGIVASSADETLYAEYELIGSVTTTKQVDTIIIPAVDDSGNEINLKQAIAIMECPASSSTSTTKNPYYSFGNATWYYQHRLYADFIRASGAYVIIHLKRLNGNKYLETVHHILDIPSKNSSGYTVSGANLYSTRIIEYPAVNGFCTATYSSSVNYVVGTTVTLYGIKE